ncbi:hypothetical protein LCGC14_1681460 [marine sediment metagenome]|uniref:Uncharacterized protein n=1 Tax=marine sediment metagenome TaxID=412755 RepID=A0A0F9KNF8_9ZZZZ
MKKTFKEWMIFVDKAVENKIGLSTADLSDFDFYGAYECGASPNATASAVIKNADETY